MVAAVVGGWEAEELHSPQRAVPVHFQLGISHADHILTSVQPLCCST